MGLVSRLIVLLLAPVGSAGVVAADVSASIPASLHAGAAVVTFACDSACTSTTPTANLRTDASGMRSAPRTSPGAVRVVSRYGRATKGEHSTVIGKVKDLDDLAPGENTLLKHLPDRGNPRGNWKQNSGVLRREMGKGRPIRDASVDPRTGELIEFPGSFLNAERALLRGRGWRYDPSSRVWRPGG